MAEGKKLNLEDPSGGVSGRALPLPLQIVAAMALGSVLGLLLGAKAAPLGILGKLLVDLIKTMAVPLVFFAIIEALVTTHIPLHKAGKLLKIVSINAALAALIGLLLSNFFHVGSYLSLATLDPDARSAGSEFVVKKLEFASALSGYLPSSIAAPFLENNIVAVVILALLIGLSIRSVRQRVSDASVPVEGTLHFAVRVCEQILSWLAKLVPVAVFGVVAKTVGQYGFAPFGGLLLYVLICTTGLLLQCLFVYQAWIRIKAGISLRVFWREAYHPLVHAFGINSSLATLPLTLKALERLGVSKASSRLGACIGTNLNNDGILLYEAVAVLYVAQVYGIELSLVSQLSAALLCIVAAIGVAGVPEAGLISLSLVLTTVGLPIEILPVLLTVDWLVARLRSVTNVMADLTVSIALDH